MNLFSKKLTLEEMIELLAEKISLRNSLDAERSILFRKVELIQKEIDALIERIVSR